MTGASRRIDGVAGMLAGPANVVMQLSRPQVGHGVVESTVRRGRLTDHPLKRGRTTATYLAVAMMGTDADRRRYRRAVDSAHAAVRSSPASPVEYNAFDPELQLWVAACLYKGAVDVTTRFWGPMDDETAEAFYRDSARLGTTLQVPDDMWPADRAAFEQYWAAALERVSIDPAVHDYLLEVVTLRFLHRLPHRFLHLPGAVIEPLGRFTLWLTTGFLPAEFRAAMELEWTGADQIRFDRLLGLIAATRRPLPPVIRRAPLNLYLWDFRLRSALGLRPV